MTLSGLRVEDGDNQRRTLVGTDVFLDDPLSGQTRQSCLNGQRQGIVYDFFETQPLSRGESVSECLQDVSLGGHQSSMQEDTGVLSVRLKSGCRPGLCWDLEPYSGRVDTSLSSRRMGRRTSLYPDRYRDVCPVDWIQGVVRDFVGTFHRGRGELCRPGD